MGMMGNPEAVKTQVSGPCWAADLVFLGADDEIRTRDPHLGKVMLYQLSHIRNSDRKITNHSARSDNDATESLRLRRWRNPRQRYERWSGGRRSIRSIKIPSSTVASASPMIAKS